MNNLLRLNISNTQPIELLDLTRALAGLSDEYRRHVESLGSESDKESIKLYVKEIRAGSIEIDLVDIATYTIPILAATAGDFNTIVDFAKNLKSSIDWLLNKSGARPAATKDVQRLKNMTAILEPVAKDRGSQMTIAPVFNGDVQGLTLNIISLQSNAAQNEICRELEELKTPLSGTQENVLLRWHQTRNDHSGTGDRAIIERISSRAVKTIFLTGATKARMLSMDENLFRRAFLVDVEVDTINGKPALYRISAIHDTIDIPEDDDSSSVIPTPPAPTGSTDAELHPDAP